ncbi:YSIRK-type signal peptide-containing protein, partial [Streptococcus pluranimalium]
MTQETKQIFSIRKFSTGTHSALLGKASLALAATAI